MNILICGFGKGSFEMRGVQIGAVLKARVTLSPSDADWRWADVAILLKRTALQYAATAQAHHVPIVWDVLDCWSQPRDNRWTIEEAIGYVRTLTKQIRPAALIGATQRMAEDIGASYLPHHCRIGLSPNPPRDAIRIVGYDGSDRYLGRWHQLLINACVRRGWSFVVNPPNLADVDVLVALRDGEWDGPVCRGWKSGVKYVNAIAAGRPILTQRCDAVEELQPIRVYLEQPRELESALDAITDDVRQAAYESAEDWSVTRIAGLYRPLLERVVTEAPCAA